MDVVSGQLTGLDTWWSTPSSSAGHKLPAIVFPLFSLHLPQIAALASQWETMPSVALFCGSTDFRPSTLQVFTNPGLPTFRAGITWHVGTFIPYPVISSEPRRADGSICRLAKTMEHVEQINDKYKFFSRNRYCSFTGLVGRKNAIFYNAAPR